MLNKPIYISASVLDLSKLLMYEFYYNVLKVRSIPQLIYMNTDSFIIQIDFKNPHEELFEYMDLRNLGKTTPFEPEIEIPIEVKDKIKGVLGVFKDESVGDEISEVIGLKSKMYSRGHRPSLIIDGPGTRVNFVVVLPV